MADCVVCMETFKTDDILDYGVSCPNGHFLCVSDLQGYMPKVFALRKTAARVPCPVEGCGSCFNALFVFKMVSAPLQLRYKSMVMSLLGEGTALNNVQRLRDAIVDLLTLKCPSCSVAVDPTPDACSAILCLCCGKHYCNLCFSAFDTSGTCHAHCAMHHPGTAQAAEARREGQIQGGPIDGGRDPRHQQQQPQQQAPNAFLPADLVASGQLALRTKKMNSFLRLAMTSTWQGQPPGGCMHDTALAMILCMDDISGTGIDALNLWRTTEAFVLCAGSKRLPETAAATVEIVGDGNNEDTNKSNEGKDAGGMKIDHHGLLVQPAPIAGYGAGFGFVPTANGKRGGQQLENAIATHNATAAIQLLHELGNDADVDFADPVHKLPLLLHAIIKCMIDLAHKLLDCGASVDCHTLAEGRSALYLAIEKGETSLVKRIMTSSSAIAAASAAHDTEQEIATSINIDLPITRSKCQENALHVAARYNHGDIIRYLVEVRGADLGVTEKEFQCCALGLALHLKCSWAVRELLGLWERRRATESLCAAAAAAQRSDSTILLTVNSAVCVAIHQAALQELDRMHAIGLFNVNQRLQDGGLSLLHKAAEISRVGASCCALLLNRGADPCTLDLAGRSVLYFALAANNPLAAEHVLKVAAQRCEWKVLVETLLLNPFNGRSPVFIAAEKGLVTVLQLIIDICKARQLKAFTEEELDTQGVRKAADVLNMLFNEPVGEPPECLRALHTAVIFNRPNVVDLLLAQGYCDANSTTILHGYTPLMLCCMSGSRSYMCLLSLLPHSDIHAVCHQGKTALFFAAEQGYCEAVALIMDRSYDVAAAGAPGSVIDTANTFFGSSCADPAVVAGDVKMAAAPVDVNAPVSSLTGDTALHVACSRNMAACVSLLLSRGARTDVRNTAGETAEGVVGQRAGVPGGNGGLVESSDSIKQILASHLKGAEDTNRANNLLSSPEQHAVDFGPTVLPPLPRPPPFPAVPPLGAMQQQRRLLIHGGLPPGREVAVGGAQHVLIQFPAGAGAPGGGIIMGHRDQPAQQQPGANPTLFIRNPRPPAIPPPAALHPQLARFLKLKTDAKTSFDVGNFPLCVQINAEAIPLLDQVLSQPHRVIEGASMHLNMSTALMLLKKLHESIRHGLLAVEYAEMDCATIRPGNGQAAEVCAMANMHLAFLFKDASINKIADASRLGERALVLSETIYSSRPNDPRLFNALHVLATIRDIQNDYAAAEQLYLRVYDPCKATVDGGAWLAGVDCQTTIKQLIHLLLRQADAITSLPKNDGTVSAATPKDTGLGAGNSEAVAAVPVSDVLDEETTAGATAIRSRAAKYALSNYASLYKRAVAKEEMVMANAAVLVYIVHMNLRDYVTSEEMMQTVLILRLKHMNTSDIQLALTMLNLVDCQEAQGKCGPAVQRQLVQALDIHCLHYGSSDPRVQALKLRLEKLRAKHHLQVQVTVTTATIPPH